MDLDTENVIVIDLILKSWTINLSLILGKCKGEELITKYFMCKNAENQREKGPDTFFPQAGL